MQWFIGGTILTGENFDRVCHIGEKNYMSKFLICPIKHMLWVLVGSISIFLCISREKKMTILT